MMEIYPNTCGFMICNPSTRRLGALIKRQCPNRLPINHPEGQQPPPISSLLLLPSSPFLTPRFARRWSPSPSLPPPSLSPPPNNSPQPPPLFNHPPHLLLNPNLGLPSIPPQIPLLRQSRTPRGRGGRRWCWGAEGGGGDGQ